MASKKILVLDKKQIGQKLNRIAYQILEDNFEEEEIILAGIVPRGYILAERLKKILSRIAEQKVQLLKLNIDKDSRSLKADTDIPVDKCKNKVIILVDDVLHTGRTLVYGVGVFLDIPLKKIRTVVLVDRSHKSYPVHIDFTGMQLSTVAKEHVQLVIDKKEEAVYLI
ncbi:MAG TPA: phosphoribosyltransferase family protein [Anseongella sp.]|nr:phosphoribosyltransferase family protein [Anseongella sp.]